MDNNKNNKPHLPESPRISYDRFETSRLPAADAFAVWRESILPLVEASLEAGSEADSFKVSSESFDLGDMFFALTSFTAQRFQRGARHESDSRANYFLLLLHLSGGYTGHNGSREITVDAGDISLLDLGRSLEARADRSDVLILIIPRDLISSWVSPERIGGGRVLRGWSPTGKILRNHLTTVWKSLPGASVHELESINQTLLGTVIGAFRQGINLDEPVEAARTHGSLSAMCAYIHENLAKSDLGPPHLCKRFACSRAQLYRLFAPVGGVARYIRDLRLARCLDELSRSGSESRQIIDVATRWGFNSHSHFSRAFRQVYGITPSEAVGRAGGTLARPKPSEYPESSSELALARWLRQR